MRINPRLCAALAATTLLIFGAAPASPQSGLFVHSPWYRSDASHFDHVAALIENGTDHYIGDITVALTLVADTWEYDYSDLEPIKRSLAPGERTLFATIVGGADRPFIDSIQIEPHGVEIDAAVYRSAGDPTVLSIEAYEIEDEDLLRVLAEVENPGPLAYRADDETGLPMRAGILALDDGEIVGIQPFVDAEPWGHLDVGGRAIFETTIDILGGHDELRLYFATTAVPDDLAPVRFEVEGLEWFVSETGAEGAGLVSTAFTVRNASTASVLPSIRWVARDVDGRFLGRDACYPPNPIDAGESITCRETLAAHLLATGDVGDVHSVTVHVGNSGLVRREGVVEGEGPVFMPWAGRR